MFYIFAGNFIIININYCYISSNYINLLNFIKIVLYLDIYAKKLGIMWKARKTNSYTILCSIRIFNNIWIMFINFSYQYFNKKRIKKDIKK